MRYDVMEFGASGGGVDLDSAAIQQAIDTAAGAGGGTVVFPAGTYRSGTIRLAGGVTLHLERGATLVGSTDIADYQLDATVPETALRYYLIQGFDCAGVAIEGDGVIDGSGAAFWQPEYYSGHTDATLPPHRSMIHYEVYKPLPARPVVLYLAGCRDVKITGITILNSPSYTIWTVGCERVWIHGVTVRNPRSGPNTDVLDIDCSRQVRISDCDLEAGDDCIALKSDPNRFGRFQGCEDIVVTNCVLSSATCAIRLGYEGDAPMRDCVFSNLVIRDSRHGIDILSITPVVNFLKIEHGTPIERIHFSNITMRNVAQAFFIWAGNEEPRRDYRACIDDLVLSQITADCVATSFIGSKDATAIHRLTMRDVRLHVVEDPDFPADRDLDAIPGHWGDKWKCGGLALRRIDGLCMDHVQISTAEGVRPALHWVEVENFTFDGAPQPGTGRR